MPYSIICKEEFFVRVYKRLVRLLILILIVILILTLMRHWQSRISEDVNVEFNV
jgi:hypothetical protein